MRIFDTQTSAAIGRVAVSYSDMFPPSVLDLSPIVEGGTAAQAFRNTLDLAQHAERWGYTRFWLAEHHNMPGIASAAPRCSSATWARAPRASASAPAASCCRTTRRCRAMSMYRERFKPSEHLEQPYVMLGVNVVAADTDEEARFMASSGRQSFASLRAGHPIQLPPPAKEWARAPTS